MVTSARIDDTTGLALDRAPRADTVRVVGHMGMGRWRSGARYGENSLPGFLAAFELGADGVEMDVHLTADDQLIVHHDYQLGRTTAAHELGGVRRISHLTAAQLAEVPLHGSVPSTIPRLDAVIAALEEVVGDGEIWVELKRQAPGRNRQLVERALKILTASPAWPNVVLRSFDNELLTEVRGQRPDARIHALSITRIEHALHVARHHRFEGIAIFHALARPAFCGAARRAGLTVTAGGEPGEAEIDRLLAQARRCRDIDYICTDKIAHALGQRATIGWCRRD